MVARRRKGHAAGLRGEIAEASRAKAGQTRPAGNQLVLTARALERLLARRRKLRRELRRLDTEIRAERKNLRALAGHYDAPNGEL